MNIIHSSLAGLLSKRFVAFLGCALACVSPAHAASVVPLYLDEVIDTSTVAFEGTCIDNRTERDGATNRVVTYTTFAVRDVLKGSVGTTHVIKQIGGSLPEQNLEYRVDGIPKFAIGQDYVLFMAGVSAAGFSSPIGLEQGRFSVKAGDTGPQVTSGRDFRDITARISAAVPAKAKAKMLRDAVPVREVDLDEFKQMVRNRVGAGR
jgi:hypothetical protein